MMHKFIFSMSFATHEIPALHFISCSNNEIGAIMYFLTINANSIESQSSMYIILTNITVFVESFSNIQIKI